MKQKQLLRTLLAAVCLLVGTNAWGGKVGVVTTNTKVNFSGSITAANPCTYTKAEDEICGTTTGWFWKSSSSPSDDNGINAEDHFFASNGNISIMMDNPTVGSKDVVNVSFDIAFGGHTSDNAAQSIKLLTTGDNLVEESYTNTAIGKSTMGLTTTDLEKMNFGGNWRNTDWSERVHFNFTVNYATRKIALVVKNTSGTAIIEKEVDMPENAGYMRGVNIGSSNQKANSRGVMFDNVYITTKEGDYGDIVSGENSYTVNNTDVYQLFTEIQCPDIKLELWGNGERSTTDYYFQYTTGSGWTSYEYTSGDIAYECAVTKYNDTAPTAADIYGADDPTDGQIAKVTVTVSDKWQTETNASKLCLTGPMATVFSGYEPIAGVIYKFTPTKDGYLNFNFYKYNKITYRAWVSGDRYYASYSSANNELKTWTLWVNKGVTYYLVSGNTQSYQMKMYSFEFIPDVSVTITDAGAATLVSDYALDFSNVNDLQAYIATAQNGANVTFTKVTGAVPAKTPLYLKGTTASVPVVASAEAVGNNLLVAGTGAGVESEADGKFNFILNKVGNEVGFYKAAGQTVATNRAYLSLSENPFTVSAKSVNMIFSNDVTGINNIGVQAKETSVKGIYNLQGQRVSNPTKGLYVIDGKKVVIK